MSNYTSEELKQMAIDTVATEGTREYHVKIMNFAIKMGINPAEAERRVRVMAVRDT